MTRPRVLNVGQCGYDHGNITRVLTTRFDAEVTAADTAAEAVEALRSVPYDLVLVNRILDVDGTMGIELIRSLKSDPALAAVPVMLVSNRAESQEEAVGVGALPGFGKAELHTAAAVDRLGAALASTSGGSAGLGG
jgi:two-component system chemotaxis response regulator CheY